MNPLASDLDHVLTHTEGLWEELRGQRIFITGGTGFFGSWLLESFAWANDKLGLGASASVLTRDKAAFQRKAPHLATNPGISWHSGELRDFSFPQGSFSHVIHAASELSIARAKDAIELMETAVLGTRRVLEFARKSGVRKLLLTSSGAVYGPSVHGRQQVKEDVGASVFPLEPRWAYGEAKRMMELMCAIAGSEYGFETKIARGFAFLGPYLPINAHFAAGNFIRDALRGEAVTVQGTGSAVRSYLYGADLALWLWTILFRGLANRPYNVGSDQAVSVADLARSVSMAPPSAVSVRIMGKPQQEGVIDYYVPDISRAREELGLGVFIPLSESIRRMFIWNSLTDRLL